MAAHCWEAKLAKLEQVKLMTATARRFAKLLFPRSLRQGLRYGFDPGYRQLQRMERDKQTGRVVYAMTGGVVCGGPFAGLRFADSEAGFTLGPKLLGTYEKELDGVVQRIFLNQYDTIVNIGAGDGFYAVGLGRHFPDCKLVCYEAIGWKHEQIQSLAQINDCGERIDIFGLCSGPDLQPALQQSGRTLVVCDVEGAELQLLDPALTPRLREADMLVEMHDVLHPGISQEIHARFAATHHVQVIPTKPRTSADWPKSIPLPYNWAKLLDESRDGPMTWSWLSVRDGSSRC
jgi:hypothetical protein